VLRLWKTTPCKIFPPISHFLLEIAFPSAMSMHTFFPKTANRGVSGIDGNIATAAGIAEALQTPVTVYIGDQTALHDLNSFSLIKEKKLLVIISNNFGGRIFEKFSPKFSNLFIAEHSLNFEMAAKMFGIPYANEKETIAWGVVEFYQRPLKKDPSRFNVLNPTS
jgi:2-succinyl-5-enolpyruvyl-6-hydroxy-3-cyclohexene-1-carboxylate synthase